MGPILTCLMVSELCFSASGLAVATSPPSQVKQSPGPRLTRFNIAPQAMRSAVQAFAAQADVSVIVTEHAVRGLISRGVQGELSLEDALTALLAGTPLTYEATGDRTFSIIERARDDVGVTPGDRRRDEVGWLSQEAPGPLGTVVTGTHFRDLLPLGPAVTRVDHEELDKAGAATVEQFMTTVPQNFGGGPTEDTVRGLEAATNSALGTAMNLRGLGAGATLTLLNGRRLAPGGAEGAFIDLSNIPLSAIGHIDILPAGASPVYGSDAVGGVINLRTRRDYSSTESRVRAGAVTNGSLDEYLLSQTFGAQWDAGGALLSFELLERGALQADDRSYARSDLRPFGGDDFDTPNGNPGTILDAGVRYAIPRGQDGSSLTPDQFVAGSQNLQDLRGTSDLLAEQGRRSALATVNHELADGISLYADLLYSQRKLYAVSPGVRALLVIPNTNAFFVSPSGGTAPIMVAYDFERDLGNLIQDATLDTANLALGVEFGLGGDWQGDVYVGYATEKQRQDRKGLVDFAALFPWLADSSRERAFNAFGDGSFTSPATLDAIRASQRLTTDSELRSINAEASGPVLGLPAGDVMLALGADRREQAFDSSNVTTSARTIDALRSDFGRSVSSVFGELRIPVYGERNRRAGLERLELSVAGRHEHYSDFGDETVPGFALLWSPRDGLAVRASWSKSFKAPNIADLDETNNLSQLFALIDPQSPASGPVPMLLWVGKNADLHEETATTWTAGLDLALEALPGLTLRATYFDIVFNDRVQEVASAFPNLADPRLAQFINRDPTPEEREAVCTRSTFLGAPGDCESASLAAIADLRIHNIAATSTRGVDVRAQYGFATRAGDFDLDLTGTYLFEFAEAISRSGLELDLLDTQHQPLDLRFRSTLSWDLRGMGATLALNYADSYRDVASQPARRIDAWTTFDLQLRYEWQAQAGMLSGTTLSLNVRNLFDEDPPFVNNQVGIGYDQENADPGGQFISLQLRKRW